MVRNPLHRLWRSLFPRHYRLAVPINRGSGPTVVFLHGIANNHRAWNFVLPYIKSHSRIVAMDLLGFGQSPAPEDSPYDASAHADAVIYTLHTLGIYGPIILVGHSMGSLVAVEVAKRQPRLVKQLILCSMPVYRMATKRGLRPRTDDIYHSIYKQVVRRQETTLKAFARLQRIAAKSVPGFGISRERWHAFERSLNNTIVAQTTLDDLEAITIPISVIIGRLDVFLIRQYAVRLAKLHDNIQLNVLNEPHDIGDRYGRYVAEVIDAAVEGRVFSPSILRQRK